MVQRPRFSAFALTLAATFLCAPPVLARPHATKPAVSVRATGTSFYSLSVSGSEFGTGGAGSSVEVQVRNRG